MDLSEESRPGGFIFRDPVVSPPQTAVRLPSGVQGPGHRGDGHGNGYSNWQRRSEPWEWEREANRQPAFIRERRALPPPRAIMSRPSNYGRAATVPYYSSDEGGYYDLPRRRPVVVERRRSPSPPRYPRRHSPVRGYGRPRSTSSGSDSTTGYSRHVRIRPPTRDADEPPSNVIAALNRLGWESFQGITRRGRGAGRGDPSGAENEVAAENANASGAENASGSENTARAENAPVAKNAAGAPTLYVIDILVGEPVLGQKVMREDYHLPRRGGELDDQQRMEGDHDRTEKPALSSQGGLIPERIRITSRFLSRILREIDGDFDGGDLRKNVPFVLLSPYRILDTFDLEIRGYLENLEAVTAALQGQDGSTDPGDTTKSEAEHKENTTGHTHSEDDGKSKTIVVRDGVDREVLDHLRCLVEFMNIYIKPSVDRIRKPACTNIRFSDLYYLFKPGTVVIKDAGRRAYVVSAANSFTSHRQSNAYREGERGTALALEVLHIAYDGRHFGPVPEEVIIEKFDGDIAVASLPIYPIRFYGGGQGEETLRKELVRRGRRFVETTAVTHMHYHGLALDSYDEIDSQVMVDFDEAFAAKPRWRPVLTNVLNSSRPRAATDTKPGCRRACCYGQNVYTDLYIETQTNEDFLAKALPEDGAGPPSFMFYPRAPGLEGFTEDELLLMPDTVVGFVLRSRKWALLDLANLTHVHGEPDAEKPEGSTSRVRVREHAFDNLVLPDGHKDMIKSLISQHFRNKASERLEQWNQDFIQGKGKGLIILLHGAPGVGKTSTAESVADYFKKPLFQITCGDLGGKAKEVEEALEMNFALANKWNCILLLDEADVFLAARNPTDVDRNSLVSVFLRILEYYAGILFLTTNRVGDFDEAFASRIHMSLHYPPLGQRPTQQVLDLNLRRIRRHFEQRGRPIDIAEGAIAVWLADYWRDHPRARLNGRQIRNACQTALALAEFEAQGASHEVVVDDGAMVELGVRQFQKVTEAYRGFMDYLKDVYGLDEHERAKEKALRAGVEGEKEKGGGGDAAEGRVAEEQAGSRSSVGRAGEDFPRRSPQPQQPAYPSPDAFYDPYHHYPNGYGPPRPQQQGYGAYPSRPHMPYPQGPQRSQGYLQPQQPQAQQAAPDWLAPEPHRPYSRAWSQGQSPQDPQAPEPSPPGPGRGGGHYGGVGPTTTGSRIPGDGIPFDCPR